MSYRATRRQPDLRAGALLCLGCHHWQLDIRPGAISDLGGMAEAVQTITEAHAAHVFTDCPAGPNGRIRIDGQWVEQPPMDDDGRRATGTLMLVEFPRWWCAR